MAVRTECAELAEEVQAAQRQRFLRSGRVLAGQNLYGKSEGVCGWGSRRSA